MKINATAVIDTLICEFDEIEKFQRMRKGERLWWTTIKENDPIKSAWIQADIAEKKLNLASDILGITISALYGMVLTARRWYNRTNWQKCLRDDDAERLSNYMMAQHPKGRW